MCENVEHLSYSQLTSMSPFNIESDGRSLHTTGRKTVLLTFIVTNINKKNLTNNNKKMGVSIISILTLTAGSHLYKNIDTGFIKYFS